MDLVDIEEKMYIVPVYRLFLYSVFVYLLEGQGDKKE